MPDLPSTDELFPAKSQSVDDLFPVEVERDRYRRQTLGTSPIQDLIFGDTSVNPVARVLSAFRQGASHAWGAEDATRLSKESEDYLRVTKQLDAWTEGQGAIAKAANESLFRPAATQIIREVRDVEGIVRGIGAGIEGTKAAIAQTGSELSGGYLEAGLRKIGLGSPEQLGRDIAGGVEALPTGFRQPTGVPHAPPHPILAEIERARDAGVIGAGEAGWKGTADVPAPTVRAEAEAVKPDIMESGMHQPIEMAPGEVRPATEVAATTGTVQPPEPGMIRFYHGTAYPDASGFEGATSVTPHEQYARNYRGGNNNVLYVDFTKEEAIKRGLWDEINDRPMNGSIDDAASLLNPLETRAAESPIAAPAAAVQRVVDEAHPIAQDVTKRLVAAGRPMEEASASGQLIANYYETRAARFEGALGTADELYAREGAQIKPGKGVEPSVVETLVEPKPIEGGAAAEPVQEVKIPNDSSLNRTASWVIRNKDTKEVVMETFDRAKVDALNTAKYEAVPIGDYLGEINGKPKAAETPQSRWDEFSANRQERRQGRPIQTGYNPASNKSGSEWRAAAGQAWEPGNIVDSGFVKNLLITSKNDDGSFTLVSKPDKNGQSKSYEAKPHEGISKGQPVDFMEATAGLSKDRELAQTQRGKIRFRDGDPKPVITLFKDANESTFIHETGHQWLEDLMKDSTNPKAPEGLLADSKAVLDWLGVEKASDIKTRHHEQFARGFERYMMEGKAPSQGLVRVFEQFKNWLTKIYQTVERLKSPINDEIRGVFDRLIALKPENVKIEPESPPKSFADIHEADALSTPPASAHPVAETIQAERDRLANEVIPEEHDARLEGIAAKAERREAGGPQPVRDGNEAGPAGREAASDQASGAVGASGSELTAEGPGASTGARQEPVSPQDPFVRETPLVDKAGNIRLDNLSTPEEVNQVIRDAAIANNDFIDARRGVVTDGQVLELADALGMDEGMINRRKLGEAFNAEQIMAARKLLIQSATKVREAMQKAATGTEADVMAYAEVKQRHRMIQEQVAGITAEAGRALRAFRKLEGQQEAKQLDAFLKDQTGKTLFQLQREAQLGMQLETPAQVSKFVNDTMKPSLKDMVIEAWMSALLSGPKTHLANIMGNTISGLWRPLETATAAGIGKIRTAITGSQERILPGEAAAELFGMVQGAREGVVSAYKAFKTGEGQLTTTRQAEQFNPRAIPSATVNLFGKERQIGGEQVRIPLRALTAEDEFFKSVAYRGDINRQAYAIAAKEGLPSEQLAARVAELSSSPTEAMIEAAKKVAEYQTFQTPLGNTGRWVQGLANSHILAKLVIPFVRTPLNLLKYAGERSPLGVFSREVRDNLSGKNGAVARDTQIARITLGTMVGVAAIEMASQGLITGGGPADPKQKAIMKANGWQDYSVKIGDMYYRYNRLDPFSIILGTVADAWEINQALGAKELEKQHLPALIFGAISKNILERASLKGPSDLIQAVTDPERYGKGYIKGLAGTVVPAIAAHTAQTLDPIMREARSVTDGLKARIPGMSQTLMPKRDVWGEPIVREGGLGPDIASPIAESRLKNDPVNKALIDASYFPGKVDRKIRGVELTDQQYDDYARIAGRTAKMRLNAIVSMPGFAQMPETTRKELMTNTITQSREMARSIVMMQNPDIMKKATDAKLKGLK